MKSKSTIIMFLVVLLFSPMPVVASGGHDHGSHGDNQAATVSQKDEHGNHDGMSADGAMAIVGSQSSKGVKGMAHIKDVSDAMAKMGMKATHHFMMAFIDEKTGEQIESGTVALKVTNPDAKVSETIELISMGGHFGADIVLDMAGEYHFKLGTRLEDGTKRKYHFHYKNK